MVLISDFGDDKVFGRGQMGAYLICSDCFGWHWNNPAGTTYASQLGNITYDGNHTHYFTTGTWRPADTA